MPQASSTMLGQNLHQTQSLYKKHKKLEAEITGHQPMIDWTLASGQTLIDQFHPEKNKVKFKKFIYFIKNRVNTFVVAKMILENYDYATIKLLSFQFRKFILNRVRH